MDMRSFMNQGGNKSCHGTIPVVFNNNAVTRIRMHMAVCVCIAAVGDHTALESFQNYFVIFRRDFLDQFQSIVYLLIEFFRPYNGYVPPAVPLIHLLKQFFIGLDNGVDGRYIRLYKISGNFNFLPEIYFGLDRPLLVFKNRT